MRDTDREKRVTRYAMSRRNRNIIIGIAIFLCVLLSVLDHLNGNNKSFVQPAQISRTSSGDIKKYHGKTFNVINVVDGDTIDIDIPDGKYDHTRIRLWGVDTPETSKSPKGQMYFGPQASEFARELVLGKKVTVYLDQGSDSNRGKYGRLLAYVKLADGRILNEVLLSEGFAYADLRFKHSFYNKYKQLESAARACKKGLWNQVQRDQLPDWLKRERPNLLK